MRERTTILEQQIIEAKRVSEMVANEINIAITIGDGYVRRFPIPERLLYGVDYEIIIRYQTVDVEWEDKIYSTPILSANVTGTFAKGYNTIRNEDGIIYVN